MQIIRQIYEDIFVTIKESPPEIGGILGKQGNLITAVEFDDGIGKGKKCSYSPDVNRLNSIIKLWQEQGINFCGIFHTHYFGVETLSPGDKEYIKNIMNSMPESITKLYFPLIVMPQREMIAYVAVKAKEQLNIYKEKIIFQGGTNDDEE